MSSNLEALTVMKMFTPQDDLFSMYPLFSQNTFITILAILINLFTNQESFVFYRKYNFTRKKSDIAMKIATSMTCFSPTRFTLP